MKSRAYDEETRRSVAQASSRRWRRATTATEAMVVAGAVSLGAAAGFNMFGSAVNRTVGCLASKVSGEERSCGEQASQSKLLSAPPAEEGANTAQDGAGKSASASSARRGLASLKAPQLHVEGGPSGTLIVPGRSGGPGYTWLAEQGRAAGLGWDSRISDGGNILTSGGRAFATQSTIESAEAQLKAQGARIQLSVGEQLPPEKLQSITTVPLWEIKVSYRADAAQPNGLLPADAHFYSLHPAEYDKEANARVAVLDELVAKIDNFEAGQAKCVGKSSCMPDGKALNAQLLETLTAAKNNKRVKPSFDKDMEAATGEFGYAVLTKTTTWDTVKNLRDNLEGLRTSYKADLDPKNANGMVMPGDCSACALLSSKGGAVNEGESATAIGQRLKVDFSPAKEEVGWNYHYATVVLKDGEATLTFETSAEPNRPKLTRTDYHFQLYGTHEKNFWAESWREFDNGLTKRGVTLNSTVLEQQLHQAQAKGQPPPEPSTSSNASKPNPTAKEISSLIHGDHIGGEFADGKYMYAVTQEGKIIVGKPESEHDTQLGLTPNENPKVVGTLRIKGGKIVDVNDAHNLRVGQSDYAVGAATDAFTRLPGAVFADDFHFNTAVDGGDVGVKPYRTFKLFRLPKYSSPQGFQNLNPSKIRVSVGVHAGGAIAGVITGLVQGLVTAHTDQRAFTRDFNALQPAIAEEIRKSVLSQATELDALYEMDPNAVVYVNTHLDITRRSEPGSIFTGPQEFYNDVSLVSADVTTEQGENMEQPKLDWSRNKTRGLTIYKHYDHVTSIAVPLSQLLPAQPSQ